MKDISELLEQMDFPISHNYRKEVKPVDRKLTMQKITSLLEDMSDTQLQNVYNYTCDEYDEEDHESHSLEIIERLARESALHEVKR